MFICVFSSQIILDTIILMSRDTPIRFAHTTQAIISTRASSSNTLARTMHFCKSGLLSGKSSSSAWEAMVKMNHRLSHRSCELIAI